MTTIKRLTGIARGGFEAMGAYGGISTRRELGGRKRTGRRAGGGAAAGRESVERGEIRTASRTACSSFSARGAGRAIFQRELSGGGGGGRGGEPSSGSEISKTRARSSRESISHANARMCSNVSTV